MHSTLAALLLTYLISAQVNAQGATCNATTPCPASAPCCSEFGFCGDDTFCLGGCNPLASNTPTSCRPNPVCQDASLTFADNSRILTNSTFFDGNASAYDWVVDKGTIMNTNSSGGELALLLTEANGGTRISSTRYVHYGKITASLKTGKWDGVVTAFITMSNVKDEIDWEFPGKATTEAQTNYFWEGVVPTTGTHGETHKGLQDTFSNYHDYTIDWQEKTLAFSIDGKVVRTIQKADAVAADGKNNYPSTPSRVQLSLWPAGINSSAPGTVQWSGGMINWNDPDYVAAGHFYATVKSVSIQCADPTKPDKNITSYVYGNSTTSVDVTFSNASTMVDGASSIIAGVSLRSGPVIMALALAMAMILTSSALV